MNYKLSAKQMAVVKAALIELDRQWRRGTANSGFSPEALELLRGANSPRPHESEPSFVLDLLSREGAQLRIVSEP